MKDGNALSDAMRWPVEAPRRLKIIRPPSFAPHHLWDDLRMLVSYRDLIYVLSLHRIKVRYKQSALGVAWAVLQPLSLMLVYSVIFTFIARMPTGETPYALFAYAALLPWTFFSTALTNATNGLVAHTQLVTKVYFPREILALTYVFAAIFDFLIAATVLLGLMVFYGAPLTPRLLYAVPIFGVLVLFTSACVLVFSAAQVRYRDVGVALPLFLQLWMFATPVVYPLSAVPASWQKVYQLNPMVGLIENFRRVTLHGLAPDWHTLALAALLALTLFIAAYLYFKTVEATMADII